MPVSTNELHFCFQGATRCALSLPSSTSNCPFAQYERTSINWSGRHVSSVRESNDDYDLLQKSISVVSTPAVNAIPAVCNGLSFINWPKL